MATLRQFCRPSLRAVGNRLRFPHVRIGACSYVSRGSRVTHDSSLGRECRVFAAHLGHNSHLGDEVVVGHAARVVCSALGDHCLIEEHSELSHCTFAAHVGVQPGCKLSDVRIGRYSYVAREACLAGVTIGAFTSIGPRALLGCGDHPANFISTAPVFFSTRRQCGATFATVGAVVERRLITLGHDVWLGAQVFVRDGVTIGDGAIVAAGAVVTADVPPYAIVGGVPAKIIRFRFSVDAIRRLQAVQWWHWDELRLRTSRPWFVQPDINAFLLHAGA